MERGEMSFYGIGEKPEYLIICGSCGNRSMVSAKHGRYCPVCGPDVVTPIKVMRLEPVDDEKEEKPENITETLDEKTEAKSEEEPKPAMTVERAMQIAREYIENDLEGAELSYVRDVLVNMIGIEKEEAEEMGIGYIFDEDEEEDEWSDDIL